MIATMRFGVIVHMVYEYLRNSKWIKPEYGIHAIQIQLSWLVTPILMVLIVSMTSNGSLVITFKNSYKFMVGSKILVNELSFLITFVDRLKFRVCKSKSYSIGEGKVTILDTFALNNQKLPLTPPFVSFRPQKFVNNSISLSMFSIFLDLRVGT